jgi:hypothetical protein
MVLLHNMMPHQHDEGSCPHSLAAVYDDGSDDHMHQVHSDWMSALLDLFSDFNGSGSCVGHFENFLAATTEASIEVTDVDVSILPFDIILFHNETAVLGNDDIVVEIIPPPDLVYDQPEFSFDPLRGTPAHI